MKPLMLMVAACLGTLPADLAAQSSPPTFQVERLDGKSLSDAVLKSISRDSVELDVGGAPTNVPLRELETLRRSEALPELELPFLPVVVLQNGSQLGGSDLRVVQRQVELTTLWGKLTFPVGDVRSVRLAPPNDKLEAAWSEMAARDTKNDLLVVPKGEALDFVAGVIGDISDKEVSLLVRGKQVALPRERAFGIVYVPQPPARPDLCELLLAGGERLRLTDVSLAGDKLLVTIGGTATAAVPLSEIAALDFTLGKVKPLGDLPMTQNQFAQSPLVISDLFKVRTNRNVYGKPLRIGNREFPRGVWIRSGVSATYRLGREYRRLTATVGLDSNEPNQPRLGPRVKVVISGDGKMIDSREVAWNDPPAALDLDVSGVRELEVRVEPPGQVPGALEHLVLGEARVIK